MTNPDIGENTSYRWTFSGHEFDESKWELKVKGQFVELERKPLEVLAYLLSHAGETVTKDELLENVWPGRIVVEASLTNALGKLRRALQDEAQEVIETQPRIGYRLIGRVERKALLRAFSSPSLKLGDSPPRRPNWRLTRQLDATASGEVWLAEQPKSGETRVFKYSLNGDRLAALKREVTVARFLKQALGDREDFVRIVDWDFDSAPYFIESEYGGSSLPQWFELQGGVANVPMKTRLDWLAQVADALASAHEIGVLHKDIKPNNLLVHGDKTQWKPRLVDFGSSRILSAERLAEIGITQMGNTQTLDNMAPLSGTPMYMAPELLAGAMPSVRSDIYSLGVVLYQLVTGDFQRPLVAGWEQDITDPLLREDIAFAANGRPEFRPATARLMAERLRQIEPRRLQRDTALAVQARIAANEKLANRAKARRPWVVIAFGCLSLGLVGTTWFYNSASARAQEAMQQRDVARALNRFVLDDMLGPSNPIVTGLANPTLLNTLDNAAPNIDQRFASQPEVAAELHMVLGRSYYALSEYGKSALQYGLSASALEKIPDEPHVKIIVRRVAQAEAFARSGNTLQANEILKRQRTEIAKLADADQKLATIYVLRTEAWLDYLNLKFVETANKLEAARKLIAVVPNVEPDLVYAVDQSYLMARARAGLPLKDIRLLEKQARTNAQKAKMGASMPTALSARYTMVRIRALAGDERLLEDDYKSVIAELNNLLGPNNEHTLMSMHGLSHVYTKMERWDDCLRVATQVKDGFTEALGANNIHTMNSSNTLSVCLLGAHKLADAEKELSASINILKGNQDTTGKLLMATMQLNLAHIMVRQNKYAEASKLIAAIEAGSINLATLDTDAAGEILVIKGQIAKGSGEQTDAQKLLQSGIAELSKKNPRTYWIIRDAEQALNNPPKLNATQTHIEHKVLQ